METFHLTPDRRLSAEASRRRHFTKSWSCCDAWCYPRSRGILKLIQQWLFAFSCWASFFFFSFFGLLAHTIRYIQCIYMRIYKYVKTYCHFLNSLENGKLVKTSDDHTNAGESQAQVFKKRMTGSSDSSCIWFLPGSGSILPQTRHQIPSWDSPRKRIPGAGGQRKHPSLEGIRLGTTIRGKL